MARRIRDIDVARTLADSGHAPSEYDPDAQAWEPGYRVVQSGRRLVLVFHDGPAEQAELERYGLELQAAGFCVIPDQMPGGGRRRLHISLP